MQEIRSRYEGTCGQRNINAEERLTEFLGTGAGREDFGQRVKTSLQVGRIRLIFVADEIPSGLRRIVEFRNDPMNLAEVLAIEIRQHIKG